MIVIELYPKLTSVYFAEDVILTSNNSEKTAEDHPLNPNPDSQWQTFFKDNEVLLQVRC